MADKKVVVIGAGVGGLTTATVLARKGFDVTVLEAQAYAGGCAGTFFHKGYRFDAGATLAAGFYPGGPMDLVAQQTGATWRTSPASVAMRVHLPGGLQVDRLIGGDEGETAEQAFGTAGRQFFEWQQKAAEAMWDLAITLPAWPPATLRDILDLSAKTARWVGRQGSLFWFPETFRVVKDHIKGSDPRLKLFVDGQLLISAQATSERVNALYGAAALDLPRRGVVHLQGGMGEIANGLAAALEMAGGRVLYKQRVKQVQRRSQASWVVSTTSGREFEADAVIANMPPWDAQALMGERPHLPAKVRDGMGAFMIHAGVREEIFDQQTSLHHQVLLGNPLGDGSSIFLSVSPAEDSSRAPAGMRAVSISTHTHLAKWNEWKTQDPARYEAEKVMLREKVIHAAEVAFPGIGSAIGFEMAGTPATYAFYTGRTLGWVGGFPQTDLFQFAQPRLRSGMWLVGDSVFPGQSTAAVALAGLRVAEMVRRDVWL